MPFTCVCAHPFHARITNVHTRPTYMPLASGCAHAFHVRITNMHARPIYMPSGLVIS